MQADDRSWVFSGHDVPTDRDEGSRRMTVAAGPADLRLKVPRVLMYHSVSPVVTGPDPYKLRVHPERFEEHVRLLRRLGLHGVPLAELVAARDRGQWGSRVALTFDDGYVDFLEYAAPVLERYGMTASV